MKSFKTTDKKNIVTRVSRWITIQRAYNIRKNNGLYDFCTDEYGYKPTDERFDPKNGTFLDFFRFCGRNFALEQFIALASVWCLSKPYEFVDTDGETKFITAVDFSGDIYRPYYIELDECGEHVRVYLVDGVKEESI